MARFKDFDAAFAEATGDEITFRLFDRDWSVPMSPRLDAVLFLERLRADKPDDQRLTRSETIDATRAVIGSSTVDEWLDLGITFAQLTEVFAFVLAAQNGVQDGDATGEAKPAASPAGRRSSNGGRSSRRTSAASTTST